MISDYTGHMNICNNTDNSYKTMLMQFIYLSNSCKYSTFYVEKSYNHLAHTVLHYYMFSSKKFFFPKFNVPFKIISAHLYEMSKSVGGTKTGQPREKTIWHTRKQNLTCLTWTLCGARTHNRHSGWMIEWLSAVMKYQRS